MRVLIVEDEAPARRQVSRLISALRPGWTLDEADSLVAVKKLTTKPDLVLSDIRLSDGNALTLFEDGTLDAPVIFITAWDAYVVAAFAHLSVDYLLKPLERAALERALAKFEKLQQHFGRRVASELTTLTRLPRERVLVRHKGAQRALNIEEVAYFRADDKLTLAVDVTGKDFIIDRTLGQLEQELDPRRFFRVNRAWIICATAVVSFKSAGRGRLELTLSPEPVEEVLVSQEHAAAFKDFMDR
ncbi:MAG: LytTR family DNA-binding domain-containing protein [Archangium sp.]